MAYRTIDQISGRRDEKVAPFLSIQQLIGVCVGVLPGMTLRAFVGDGLLGLVVLLACGAVGYLLATEIDGMSPSERLLWHGRGLVRGVLYGTTITPDDLPGAAVELDGIGISWRGGVVAIHDDALAMLPAGEAGVPFPLPPSAAPSGRRVCLS